MEGHDSETDLQKSGPSYFEKALQNGSTLLEYDPLKSGSCFERRALHVVYIVYCEWTNENETRTVLSV